MRRQRTCFIFSVSKFLYSASSIRSICSRPISLLSSPSLISSLHARWREAGVDRCAAPPASGWLAAGSAAASAGRREPPHDARNAHGDGDVREDADGLRRVERVLHELADGREQALPGLGGRARAATRRQVRSRRMTGGAGRAPGGPRTHLSRLPSVPRARTLSKPAISLLVAKNSAGDTVCSVFDVRFGFPCAPAAAPAAAPAFGPIPPPARPPRAERRASRE